MAEPLEALRQSEPLNTVHSAQPLLLIATASLPVDEVVTAWHRWRGIRPDLDHVTDAEVAVLPAAWARAQAAGVTDIDAGRLDGLRRLAALHTAVTIRGALQAQQALRQVGVPSAVAGAASAVLWGALAPDQRSVRRFDLWVARADIDKAVTTLGGQRGTTATRLRARALGRIAPQNLAGGVLRFRLPSIPTLDGRALVAARQVVQWAGSEVEVLAPTEAVFTSDVLAAAREFRRRIHSRFGGGAQVEAPAAWVERQLDRALLCQLDGFDPARLQRLHAAAGWRSMATTTKPGTTSVGY
jgi:hypothetical protein